MSLTAAASYAALFAILLAQALRGQPVVAPDPMTAIALAAWAAATIGAIVTLNRRPAASERNEWRAV